MIDLRFNFFPLIFFNTGDIDLVVEMADIANDGLVFHFRHVVVGDDVEIARRRDENISFVRGVVHGHDAIAFHRRLQRADRIDFRDPNLRRQRA